MEFLSDVTPPDPLYCSFKQHKKNKDNLHNADLA